MHTRLWPAGLGLHRRLRPATAAVRSAVTCYTLCACMLRVRRTASSAASTRTGALSLVPVVHTGRVCSARCMTLVYLQPRTRGITQVQGWAAVAAAQQPRAGARPARAPARMAGQAPHAHAPKAPASLTRRLRARTWSPRRSRCSRKARPGGRLRAAPGRLSACRADCERAPLSGARQAGTLLLCSPARDIAPPATCNCRFAKHAGWRLPYMPLSCAKGLLLRSIAGKIQFAHSTLARWHGCSGEAAGAQCDWLPAA